MNPKTKHAIHELSRLGWDIGALIFTLVVFLVVGISRANLEVLIFKVAVFSAAVALVHMHRQRIFDYISLEECIFGTGRFKNVPVPIRAVVAAGMFFLFALGVYALTEAI